MRPAATNRRLRCAFARLIPSGTCETCAITPDDALEVESHVLPRRLWDHRQRYKRSAVAVCDLHELGYRGKGRDLRPIPSGDETGVRQGADPPGAQIDGAQNAFECDHATPFLAAACPDGPPRWNAIDAPIPASVIPACGAQGGTPFSLSFKRLRGRRLGPPRCQVTK